MTKEEIIEELRKIENDDEAIQSWIAHIVSALMDSHKQILKELKEIKDTLEEINDDI